MFVYTSSTILTHISFTPAKYNGDSLSTNSICAIHIHPSTIVLLYVVIKIIIIIIVIINIVVVLILAIIIIIIRIIIEFWGALTIQVEMWVTNTESDRLHFP